MRFAQPGEIMERKEIGPNARRLLAHLMALEAVPKGGGIQTGLSFLSEPERLQQGIRDAMAKLEEALSVVKSAPDNPYGNDDEAIAGAILRRIDQRKRGEGGKPG